MRAIRSRPEPRSAPWKASSRRRWRAIAACPRPSGRCRPFEIRQHRRYNPGGSHQPQYRAGSARRHPHHDHADLHGALGDARDRARHDGEPARHADRAARDHDRQDRALRRHRLHPGDADPNFRHARVRGADHRQRRGCLALLSTLFIATNLSIGYTFSTIAQNQLQAIQMSFMFFLPNILLSGFMFPFAGMPRWAQVIGECLPLTHYIRIVRGHHAQGSRSLRSAHGGAGAAGSHAALP